MRRGSGWPDPCDLTVRNEVTSSKASLANITEDAWQRRGESLVGSADLVGLPLTTDQQWSRRSDAVAWEIDFRGDATRVGHEVTIELPMLTENSQVFTPTERGVMEVAAYPTFQGLPYATNGWDTGQAWVLPLMSVMDPQSDHAITIAVAGRCEHSRICNSTGATARTLRMTLAHRGMGGGQPSPLTLLFFAHAADYRAALRAYSDAFPRYFRSPLPRGPYEGTFWYHHIQDHPAPEEMARQSVRYIWSSFWFTHLGEYLPDAQEWEPLHVCQVVETGPDHERRQDPGVRAARCIARNRHLCLLQRDRIRWCGRQVRRRGGSGQNPPREVRQCLGQRRARKRHPDVGRRHGDESRPPVFALAVLRRPGPPPSDAVAGDRWLRDRPTGLGEPVDYAHDDGLSMIGQRPVENLAVPVSEAVHRVVELSHAAGKRVFVNQFYRVEVLRDVDGVCHENDYLPALGYLTPLRPRRPGTIANRTPVTCCRSRPNSNSGSTGPCSRR